MVNQVLCHISNTAPFPALLLPELPGSCWRPTPRGPPERPKRTPPSNGWPQRYGVSVPQLCIRYDLQLGMVVLPKAANPEHMRENASLTLPPPRRIWTSFWRLPPIQDYGPFRHFPVFGGKKNG